MKAKKSFGVTKNLRKRSPRAHHANLKSQRRQTEALRSRFRLTWQGCAQSHGNTIPKTEMQLPARIKKEWRKSGRAGVEGSEGIEYAGPAGCAPRKRITA